MNELFLHHIWKFKKFDFHLLKTLDGQNVELIKSGNYNTHSGPDFQNAEVIIGELKWIGNVEIHLRSSDWERHHHSRDKNYQNIILHVVYEHDKEISFLLDNNIPTVELKDLIPKEISQKFQNINHNKYLFIPCESIFNSSIIDEIPGFSERLYIQKLEIKTTKILDLLKLQNNDWEFVLLSTLAYNLGGNVNNEIFEQMIQLAEMKVIRKISHKTQSLEALFLGICNELNEPKDEYSLHLQKEFLFFKNKFHLPESALRLKYLRLRPSGFPGIRISQMANLLSHYQNLFSYVVGCKTLKQYYELLAEVKTTDYWKDHYVLGKETSIKKEKKLSEEQQNSLIINTFLPVKFAYSQYAGKNLLEDILQIIQQLPKEKNSVIDKFSQLGIGFNQALHTQSFLHLYKNYCSFKQCLNCEIGFRILRT